MALTENLSFDGKDVTKWGLLSTEDEVKQVSCWKILGADHIGGKIPHQEYLWRNHKVASRKWENSWEVRGLEETIPDHQFDLHILGLINFR